MTKILPPNTRYVGIDPGEHGGLAVIQHTESGYQVTQLHRMPPTEQATWRLIRALRPLYTKKGVCVANTQATLERVGGYMPQKGKRSDVGSAMFRFGANWGFWRGCLVAAGIPFQEPTPMQWMKEVGVPRKPHEETRVERKRRLLQHAQWLYPMVKLTLSTCDAVLLAEFCRRVTAP